MNFSGPYTPFEHQMASAYFLMRHKRAFCFSEIGCVDASTEYLTPTGWRRIDEYSGGEVAQYNVETKRAEFVVPSKYTKEPHARAFYHIKTKYGLDQMLTPGHRVLYVRCNGELAVLPAAEVYRRHHKNKLGFTGRIITTYKAPETDGSFKISDEMLRVQVASIADGHFPNSTTRCTMRLKKERKKARIRKLLDAAGIDYSCRCCVQPGFEVFSFHAPLNLKHFDDRFWSLQESKLRVVADEVMYWDGSHRKASAGTFFSTNKESADFIQHCLIVSGRTTSLNTVVRDDRGSTDYTVHARAGNNPLYIKGTTGGKKRVDNIKIHRKSEAYKYCFEVPSSFLVLRRNGRVFITGNTGKTLSALWAADNLISAGVVKKILIAAPLSTLWRVWADDVFKHFPHREHVVLYGPKAKRLERLDTPADFYIINLDGVKTIEKALYEADFDLVIVDEGAILRNARTERFKCFFRLFGPKRRNGLWWLTGAPMPKAPTDCWAQARMVAPDLVPWSFVKFRDRVMYQASQFSWLPRSGWQDYVFSILKPAIRYIRDECLDLPPCVTEQRQVKMSREQEKAYEEMKQHLIVEFEEGRVTAANEGVKLMKLVQIASAAIYAGSGIATLQCKPKLQALREVLDESGGKCIVFAPFIHTIKMLHKELKSEFKVGVVYGDVSPKRRSDIFHDFQSGDLEVLLAQPATMAHGLTLTASHTVCWWAPIESYEIYEQANGRITRPGQKVKQTIVQLSCSEVEQLIYRRLRRKEKLQGILLDMLRSN